MTTDHVQKGIEQHAAQQAMRLAVLACQVEDKAALAKGAAAALRTAREDMAEWAEYDGARAEFQANTAETRKELAELGKAYREALARTEAGRYHEGVKLDLRMLRGRLKAAAQESRQMLMPYAEE